MINIFKSSGVKSNGPSLGSFVVTPHNTNLLARPIRGVSINVSGTIAYTNWDGEECVTSTLPIGNHSMCATVIKATGTTATGITGWY